MGEEETATSHYPQELAGTNSLPSGVKLNLTYITLDSVAHNFIKKKCNPSKCYVWSFTIHSMINTARTRYRENMSKQKLHELALHAASLTFDTKVAF